MSASLIVGIFVGGQGRRMGGVAKGLLRAPASELTLVERLMGETRAIAPDAELVLVGAAPAYAPLGATIVADVPSGIGPLGGLRGLLAHAEQRGAESALVLACDLPRLDRETLARLRNEAPHADALVAELGGVRNPLIARYAVGPTRRAAEQVFSDGKRSLQAVLDLVRVACLTGIPAAVLDDWDAPDDVR